MSQPMPKAGEFLARFVGQARNCWMHCRHQDSVWLKSLSDGYVYRRDQFDLWMPLPTEDHLLVDVDDLEDLLRVARGFPTREELKEARAKVGLP